MADQNQGGGTDMDQGGAQDPQRPEEDTENSDTEAESGAGYGNNAGYQGGDSDAESSGDQECNKS